MHYCCGCETGEHGSRLSEVGCSHSLGLSQVASPSLRPPKGLWGSLTVAFVLAAAGAAVAQTSGASITPPSGDKRFSADIRGNVVYGSNVAGGGDVLAAIRRVEPSDVTFDTGATIKFQLLTGRNVAFLTAAADARRHVRNKILDGEDYQVSTGVGTQLGPCSGLVGASFSRRRSLIEDLALPVTNSISEQPSASFSLSCSRSAFIGSAQASIGKIRYKNKKQGFVDSETIGGSVSVGYRSNTIGDVSLITQYSMIGYSDDPASLPPSVIVGDRGFEQYGVGIQYARKVGMRLSGTAAVLASQMRGSRTKSSGVNANATLTYRATSRIQVDLGFELGNQASTLINTNYLRTQSTDLKVNYRLSQRVLFSVGVRGTHDQYRGGISIPSQLRDSKQLSENLSGSMKLGRKSQIIVSAEHLDRNADVSLYDFSSDNVKLGFTTQF